MAAVLSDLCTIMEAPCYLGLLEQAMQHGHLRRHAVMGLAQHHAARTVENVVGDGDVTPHRQAVHEFAGRLRRCANQLSSNHPVAKAGAQRRHPRPHRRSGACEPHSLA